jgi:hypothetical protein
MRVHGSQVLLSRVLRALSGGNGGFALAPPLLKASLVTWDSGGNGE